MIPDIEKLGKQLFMNIEAIREMWSNVFGLDFQKTWINPGEVIKNAVTFARDTIESFNDIDKKASHSTLFMRDPLTDRLILEYSTNNELNKKCSPPPSDRLFKDKRSSYDKIREECFYNLHDSLYADEEKRNDIARETRGLTGWVALTGIPLRVNSSRSQESLDDMIKENLLAVQACEKYGYPKWSNRISEFLRPSNTRDWSTRFMAVPIQSKIDSSKTIGVIRYSCPIKLKELSSFDLLFLKSVADLISTLKNIEQVKILCNRDRELEKEILSFQQNGDFSEFLKFISYSLRSRISSLYIYIGISNNNMLRMIDAYGISGYTGDIRDQLNDYSEHKSGLTWEIFKKNDLDPVVYTSVVQSDAWRGKNTKIFYGKALGELGIQNIEKSLENDVNKKELLTRHPIKLMGCSLRKGDNLIGVLKVEFPEIFDDSQHYNDADKEFFKKCAEIIKEELHHYQEFIVGDWFKDDKGDRVGDFIRYMTQIYRYKLVSREDYFKNFWNNVQTYAKKYSSQIQKENTTRLGRSPNVNKPYLVMLKNLCNINEDNKEWGWFKEVLISETTKQLVDKLAKLIF